MTKDVLMGAWIVGLMVWVVGAIVLRTRSGRNAAVIWIGVGAPVLFGFSRLIE